MKLFSTDKVENRESRWTRFKFNFFPAYRRTGARISFISSDWKEVHIRLALNWKTRNYVGSVFGGSIYAAIDPIYMIQFIKILGKDYVVWDKSATIRFLRPVKETIKARFLISDDIIVLIKKEVQINGETIIELPVQFIGKSNKTVYAESDKVIYIADKEYYRNKRINRK